MAKVEFVKPIEAIHGKLEKSDTIGFARRTEANNDEERVKYTFSSRKRKYSPTSAQRAHNTKFGNICKLTHQKYASNTQIASLKAAFKAQSTYKTLYAYVWNKCAEELNA